MASKRPQKKAIAKRTKTAKKKKQFQPFLKIPIGLAILLTLVILAGFLTHHLISKRYPVQMIGGTFEKSRNSMPDFQFEIYPEKEIPLPKEKKSPKKTPPEKSPRIALIVDDIGYDRAVVKKFLSLNLPITFSILPKSPFTKSIIKEARKKHVEIMLHQPMEPFEYPRINPGPGTLLTNMTPDELVQQLIQNLEEMPFVSGINNHMGSKMTASASQMRQIFSVLKQRKLFFVDSRTTEKTICRPSAGLLQIPFGERDIFVDHFQESDFIKKQLYELVRIATTHGDAIGIAHPYTKTYQVLKSALPDLKQKVRFVPVSEVVKVSG
jgi:polysaccharide deacetylase 2 family uncharacterized protein YibQ